MFDLDGTLIDSRPGIEASARSALAELGLDPAAQLDGSWLGSPLSGLIASLLPDAGPDDRDLATRAFTRHYDDTGWQSSYPYPGAKTLIEKLHGAGVRVYVVTNKRRAPVLAILDRHELLGYFEAIYTPDSKSPRYASKGEMGRACITEHGLNPSSTLVVGDSRDDQEMAQECGTVFGAASWGYGRVVGGDAAQRQGSQPNSASPGPPDVILKALTDLEILIGEAGGKSSR